MSEKKLAGLESALLLAPLVIKSQAMPSGRLLDKEPTQFVERTLVTKVFTYRLHDNNVSEERRFEFGLSEIDNMITDAIEYIKSRLPQLDGYNSVYMDVGELSSYSYYTDKTENYLSCSISLYKQAWTNKPTFMS